MSITKKKTKQKKTKKQKQNKIGEVEIDLLNILPAS